MSYSRSASGRGPIRRQRLQRQSGTGLCRLAAPGTPLQLANTGAPLLIVDHAHEWNTPAHWGPQLQRVIGGARLRITDDGHGSLITLKQCMPAAVSFLTTGQRPTATCQVPLPKPVYDPNE